MKSFLQTAAAELRLTSRMAAGHREIATALVERAKRGDHQAFEELVRRYRDRIVALALHLSGTETDAEDITQEVFLKAYLKLSEFEGRSHFFTWIYRMTVNRALNARRDQKRRRETGLDDPRVERAVRIDAAGNPERATELRQTYRQLMIALDALPTAMKTSVVLVTLQGLSHAEAAVVQDCCPGTVAWRIHEARSRLRRVMRRMPPPTPGQLSRKHREREPSAELSKLLREWSIPALAPAN